MKADRVARLASLCGGALLVGAIWFSAVRTIHAVKSAEMDATRADAVIAGELMRIPAGPEKLDLLFGDRWILEDESLVGEEPSAEFKSGVPVGTAPVFDEDGWFKVGAISVSGDRSRSSIPLMLLVWILTASVLLSVWIWHWKNVPWGSDLKRLLVVILGLASVGVPLGVWSNIQLTQLSMARVDRAAEALRFPEIYQWLEIRPGGIGQFTSLGFIEFDEERNPVISNLPTASVEEATDDVVKISSLMVLDQVPFVMRDVGRHRLAFVPYSHTHTVVVYTVIACLLAAIACFVLLRFARLEAEPLVMERQVTAWSFLAPSALHLCIFTLGPLAAAGWLSFHRWSLVDIAKPFIGLDNYLTLLKDSEWWRALFNTAVYTMHVPVAMALSLAVALMVHRRIRGIAYIRAIFFLPTITSLVAIAMVWQWMLDSEFGIVNRILGVFGIEAIPWLSSTSTAMPGLMLMAVWLVVGYQMVLFLAGLSAIPESLYDAARIDGANAWQRFVNVTLPGLKHTIFFVFVTSVIGSFQVFGAVFVMTQGGPLHSTDVAVFHIYLEAWEFLRFGKASAMSWVLFAVIFAVTMVQFKLLERRAEEAA